MHLLSPMLRPRRVVQQRTNPGLENTTKTYFSDGRSFIVASSKRLVLSNVRTILPMSFGVVSGNGNHLELFISKFVQFYQTLAFF